MFKYNLLFVSFWCLLLIDNTYSKPANRNQPEREYSVFDPEFWSSLLDDYLTDSDDELSSGIRDKIRPVVVCSPPNCTIVINVQNGGHLNPAPPHGPAQPLGPVLPIAGQQIPNPSGVLPPVHGGIPIQGSGYNVPSSIAHVQMPSSGYVGVQSQGHVMKPSQIGFPQYGAAQNVAIHPGAAQSGAVHPGPAQSVAALSGAAHNVATHPGTGQVTGQGPQHS